MTKRKKTRRKSVSKDKAIGAALTKCRAAIAAYYRHPDVYASDLDALLACIVLTAPGWAPVGALQAAAKARGGVA